MKKRIIFGVFHFLFLLLILNVSQAYAIAFFLDFEVLNDNQIVKQNESFDVQVRLTHSGVSGIIKNPPNTAPWDYYPSNIQIFSMPDAYSISGISGVLIGPPGGDPLPMFNGINIGPGEYFDFNLGTVVPSAFIAPGFHSFSFQLIVSNAPVGSGGSAGLGIGNVHWTVEEGLVTTAIPEPSTILLFGLGLIAAGVRRFSRHTR